MLGLFRYFLFASAASLLFHPYLARANWPVARYTNGTVGLINDGGEVHVQSAKLQVNGHLKVEGDLIVNSSNVALELTNLKPPKCMPPGGDKLQFDGMNWICVCNGAWTGLTCEQPPSPPPPPSPLQPTVPPPDQSKLSFGVSANFQGSSKDPPCPDEFPFWISCRLPSGGSTSGWSGTRNDNCNWGSQFRNWDEIEASYNSYDSGDLMGCGGHQYGYPTSIKSYYESINILSVIKVQYDELVAGGLVPVATPQPPPNPIPNANLEAFVAECLDDAPVTGECTTWASGNNYGTMPNWDVSRVSDLKEAFKGYDTFNADISKWDTSSVTTMYYMFHSAYAFDQDIGSWNTEKVTSMFGIFWSAHAFNQDIGNWNTEKVTNMWYVFRHARAFNQDIGNWNTEKVTAMGYMFNYAFAFNQDIGGWSTEKVTRMDHMFREAIAFNQDISSWTGSAATSAQNGMFAAATAFLDKFTCTNAITGPASSCVPA